MPLYAQIILQAIFLELIEDNPLILITFERGDLLVQPGLTQEKLIRETQVNS